MDDAPNLEVGVRCFYTSPNELAWSELAKMNTLVLTVDNWSVDELIHYYQMLGCNGVLVNALKIPNLSNVPEEMDFHFEPDAHDPTLLSVYYQGSSYNFTVQELRDVVTVEAIKCGPVPRNMFQTVPEKIMHRYKLAHELAAINPSVTNLYTCSLNYHMCRSLLRINPVAGNPLCWNSDWLGTDVVDMVVQRIANNSIIHNSDEFTRALCASYIEDAKTQELLRLTMFCMFPSRFIFQLATRARKTTQLIKTDNIGPKVVSGTIPSIIRVTNKEMECFVVDFHDRRIASPLNDIYPGIDGVAHLQLTDAQGNGMVSAFMQITNREEHNFTEEGKVALRHLCGKMRAAATAQGVDHQSVFLWLVKEE